MSCKTTHEIAYEVAIPLIQRADNPGGAMRNWLIAEDFSAKDIREFCVAIAIEYRCAFDQRNRYKQLYKEARDR